MVEADAEQARMRLNKQNYLEVQIMQKGYDVNSFANYMWY